MTFRRTTVWRSWRSSRWKRLSEIHGPAASLDRGDTTKTERLGHIRVTQSRAESNFASLKRRRFVKGARGGQNSRRHRPFRITTDISNPLTGGRSCDGASTIPHFLVLAEMWYMSRLRTSAQVDPTHNLKTAGEHDRLAKRPRKHRPLRYFDPFPISGDPWKSFTLGYCQCASGPTDTSLWPFAWLIIDSGIKFTTYRCFE
jgi:hypothetical protein